MTTRDDAINAAIDELVTATVICERETGHGERWVAARAAVVALLAKPEAGGEERERAIEEWQQSFDLVAYSVNTSAFDGLRDRALALMRQGGAPATEDLRARLAQWQDVGERIQEAATGKRGQLSDSDVIGEIDALRYANSELVAAVDDTLGYHEATKACAPVAWLSKLAPLLDSLERLRSALAAVRARGGKQV